MTLEEFITATTDMPRDTELVILIDDAFGGDGYYQMVVNPRHTTITDEICNPKTPLADGIPNSNRIILNP